MANPDPIGTAGVLAAELLVLLRVADASGLTMAAIHIDAAIAALCGSGVKWPEE